MRDTDGDGDCAACARNPDAPCRVSVDMSAIREDAVERAKERLFREGAGEFIGIRIPEQKPPTYDELVAMMERLSQSDHRDSWGNTPDDIRRHNLAIHPLYQVPVSYHSRPKEFMQGEGQGLPYTSGNHWHFWMRYGTPHRPGIRVGVLRHTPKAMAEAAAAECAAREALHILSVGVIG